MLPPPPGLTLNARLIAWQHTRREQLTNSVFTRVLTRLASAGLAGREVRIEVISGHPRRRSIRPRRRVAAALARRCRAHDADMLIPPTDTRLVTSRAQRHLARLASPGCGSSVPTNHVLPDIALV